MSTPVARVPTINDLRVKLCYICREEERTDVPDNSPPRAWTHPCNCTLIAHEDCLLKWIQSSQSTASRAPNALKCPQCSTAYEIESQEPFMLKVLSAGNRVMQRCGTYFTLLGVGAATGLAATSVYICLTAYGAYAVEKFIGKEMFNVILTDDPINWPWLAYFNLPLVPVALVLSRFTNNGTALVIPLLLAWPPSQPVGEPARRLYEFWSKPDNASKLVNTFLSATGVTPGQKRYIKLWPPPPMFFGFFCVPFIRAFYTLAYRWAYKKLLGVPVPRPRNIGRGLRLNEGPFVIRILAGDGEGQGQEGQQQPEGQGQAPNPEDADLDPEVAAVQAAEQLIEVNATSIGRRVGGALLIPAISNMMGSLLFRLSKRSHLLRIFLGIAEPSQPAKNWVSSLLVGNFTGPGSGSPESDLNNPQSPIWDPLVGAGIAPWNGITQAWKEMTFLRQMTAAMRLSVNAVFGGTRLWIESDPVWWRNGVGFALFVAAKDVLYLLHLWLKKREIESRRVKDRDFSGVDVRELDLLPSWANGIAS